MPRHLRWLVVGLALCGPLEAAAQRASLGYQSLTSSEDHLRTLRGGSLRVHWPNSIELSAELGLSRWTEVGSACVGLIIDPTQCPLETVDWKAEMTGFALAYPVAEAGFLGGTFWVVPSLGFALIHLTEKGRTTGYSPGDSQLLLEAGLAARYTSAPVWRLVRLMGEARVAASKDPFDGGCADCFDPLSGGGTHRSFLLGLSIGR